VIIDERADCGNCQRPLLIRSGALFARSSQKLR
jgi:hypothetical protein